MNSYKKIDTFSNRLKTLLTNENLKQSDLARLTNLSKQQISQYVNGKFEPRPTAVLNIAKVLDIDELWLMGYDVPMNRQIESTTNSETDRLLNEVLYIYENLARTSQVLEKTIKDMTEFSKDIEKSYGEKSIDLLEHFSKLNSTGKDKILELINDLLQIDKYIVKE